MATASNGSEHGRLRFVERHPYATAVGLACLQILIQGAAAVGVFRAGGTAEDVILFGDGALAVTLVFLLTRRRWWGEVGFRRPREPWLVWLAACPLIVLVDNPFGSVAIPPLPRLARLVMIMALVGFVEETIYRGLMIRVLIWRGVWRAAIVSSALFGLAHGFAAVAGQDLTRTALQVAFASGIGFAYAAAVIRSGAVWPAAIVHTLINVTAFLTGEEILPRDGPAGLVEMLVPLGWALILTIFGVVVLRRASGSPRRLTRSHRCLR